MKTEQIISTRLTMSNEETATILGALDSINRATNDLLKIANPQVSELATIISDYLSELRPLLTALGVKFQD